MQNLDERLTTHLRKVGKPLLPLWIALASYGMWGFPLTMIVLVFLGVGNPLSWLALCIPVTITQFLTLALQKLIGRPRPSSVDTTIHMWWHTSSFPSAHSAGSMAFAVTMSSVLLSQSGVSILWSIGMFLLAISIGLSRIMVGVHYVGDVVVGFLFGIVVTNVLLSIVS
jgi:undecaprenyl-diphosphatase